MALSTEQQASYAQHIDKILAESDLTTVSVKKVRNKLQEITGQDLTELKAALNGLITERFDHVAPKEEAPPSPQFTNGLNQPIKKEKVKREAAEEPSLKAVPAKKRKTSTEDEDSKLAAMLQAEENRSLRPTRGAAVKKKVVKKAAAKGTVKKKKSSKKVRDSDDSAVELDSNGEEKPKKKKRGGGTAFMKEWALSEPLSALVGATQLSRPGTVKKIWEHIKANDLQKEGQRSTIVCDDKMKAVFKVDEVHMFTMNKILSKHFYPLPGDENVVKPKKEPKPKAVKKEVKEVKKVKTKVKSEAKIEESEEESEAELTPAEDSPVETTPEADSPAEDTPESSHEE